MKKVIAVVAVLAITLMSSMAFAEINLSGSVETRGRAFNNTDNNKDVADYDRDTQTRVRINFDGKAGDAKAKVTVERDYETWGGACAAAAGSFAGVECVNGPLSAIREAWVLTPIGAGLNLKGGHMLLSLGNGWFFRNMKYGTDAWVLFTDIGTLHLGAVNGKIAEVAKDQDLNMNALVVTNKMSDSMNMGVNLSQVNFTRATAASGGNVLYNVGLHADMKLGDLKLKAEVDVQTGRDNTTCGGVSGACAEYKGNQIVVEGNLPAGEATINFLVARGSGNDTPPAVGPASIDVKQFVPILDGDPRSTFLYEYKMKTAGMNFNGATTQSGFANTTALSAGADVKLGNVTVGGNLWYLMASEDVNLRGATTATGGLMYSGDLGIEIDARVNVKLSDAVSLNTTLGYFMPGDAYARATAINGVNKDADETTGIQSVLSMKF